MAMTVSPDSTTAVWQTAAGRIEGGSHEGEVRQCRLLRGGGATAPPCGPLTSRLHRRGAQAEESGEQQPPLRHSDVRLKRCLQGGACSCMNWLWQACWSRKARAWAPPRCAGLAAARSRAAHLLAPRPPSSQTSLPGSGEDGLGGDGGELSRTRFDQSQAGARQPPANHPHQAHPRRADPCRWRRGGRPDCLTGPH